MTVPAGGEGTEALLRRVAAGRGYLLPHHRLLALHAPRALAAYDALYRSLTLEPRALPESSREAVWLALLAVRRKFSWRIHYERACAAGLDAAAVADALALGAHALAEEIHDHGAAEWSAAVPAAALAATRERVEAAARGTLPAAVAHLCLAAAHATRGYQPGVRRHVVAALAAGAQPAEVAEALSFVLLECGANALIEATDTWLAAARAGECPPPYDQIESRARPDGREE